MFSSYRRAVMPSRRVSAIAILITLATSGCGGGSGDGGSESSSGSKDTVFETAYTKCTDGDFINALSDEPVWKVEEQIPEFFQVADEGKTFIANGVKSDMVGFLGCFLTEFDTPQAIVAAMDATTSMMGRQEQSDGDMSYQWTYHPDNGMNLIVTDASES